MKRFWRLLGALICLCFSLIGGTVQGQVTPQTGGTQAGIQGEGHSARDGGTTAYCCNVSFNPEDEIILEVTVSGAQGADILTGFVKGDAVYLPLGATARLLDLAIRMENGGSRAEGWVLQPGRTLLLDLQAGTAQKDGQDLPPDAQMAGARDGELYLRTDWLMRLLPLALQVDLRAQQLTIVTTEPFPFQERIARAAAREKLLRRPTGERAEWPVVPLSYRMVSVPSADLGVRLVSDSALGARMDGDLRLAGDFARMSADLFVTGDSVDGLTGALLAVGRADPGGRLLGPLRATEYTLGDVSSFSLPIGLAAVTGRGFALSNTELTARSVFETIDLRGVLPEGFEVELFRNGILLASLRDSADGQFFFPQVPVEFGLNEFLLVFHGPQGQRREELRRFMVGDGRLAPGRLAYRIAALQKDRNLLGVEGPRTLQPADRGDLRATAELAYGVTPALTAVFAGAWRQRTDVLTGRREDGWLASAGARTGFGRWAAKADLALADKGAWAATAGIGGQFGSTSLTAAHSRYGGGFRDETRSFGQIPLSSVTELDVRTNLSIGPVEAPSLVPVSLRARHSTYAGGGSETDAALRASAFLPGVLLAGSLEFRQTALGQANKTAQLFGNFDLATRSQGRTRLRGSLSYEALPRARLAAVDAEIDRTLGPESSIRATLGYSFAQDAPQASVAFVRQFDRFALSADAGYRFGDNSYVVGLRLAASLGRDPLHGRFFVSRPGLAANGGAVVRAFQDMDGDGRFGKTDRPLPEVTFMTSNEIVPTDADGVARLLRLPVNQPVSIQLDPTSLPDISLAPANRGVTVVPRAGRLQAADYPVVALSEVEGTIAFADATGTRPVASVRVQLVDTAGKTVAEARSESDGYYLFEQIQPGSYKVRLDPDQAQALNLCLRQEMVVDASFAGDIMRRDLVIARCGEGVRMATAQLTERVLAPD